MASAATKKSFFGMTNPVIRKLNKVNERAEADGAATYGGVIGKTVFFLLLTVVGIGLFYFYHQIAAQAGFDIAFTSNKGVISVETNTQECIVFFGALIVTIVTAILSSFIRATIVVTGTIYVLAEGYVLGFIVNSLAEDYEFLGFLALVLTVCLVLVMLFLFRMGVRPSERFRKIIGVVFGTIILGSLVTLIMSFIPGLSQVVQAIAQIRANPVVSLVIGIVFIIIACLFLLSDFESIHQMVENRLPKKYEWACAFGLAYTVLYLYLKILQILIEIFGNSKK